MSFERTRLLHIALLLSTAAALLFVRLGSSEIESWDEGLYIARAQSILVHGDWLDQTSHSLGGLYSSTHPPVGIWCMAISARVFGLSEWSLRLPGALLGVSSILVLYLLLCRLYSPTASFFTALGVLTAGVFVHLARHAQLDIYLFFFSALALWLYSRGPHDSKNVVLAGVAFGLALLSKFGFALLLAPIFGLLTPKRETAKALVTIAIASCVAAPWYLYMWHVHPDFGLHALKVAGTSGYESSGHAWWYYLNQLVIALPLLLGSVVVLRWNSLRTFMPLLAVAIVLVAMATTEAHYVLLLLLPAAFFAAQSLDALLDSQAQIRWIGIALIATAFLWSLSEQVRLLVRGILRASFILPFGEALLCAGLVVAVFCAVRRSARSTVTVLACLAAAAVGQRLYRAATVPDDYSGIKRIATKLQEVRPTSALVLTSSAPHEELVPQFAYYAAQLGLHQYDTRRRDSAVDYANYQVVVTEHRKERLAELSTPEAAQLKYVDSTLSRSFHSALRTSTYTLYYSTP